MENLINERFYNQVFDVLQQAKAYAGRAVNFAAVLANWHTGRLIIEQEQNGQERAGYGDYLIKGLSERLTHDFGKGYDTTNLKLFRKFYLEFPAWIPVNQKGDSLSNLLPDFGFYEKGDTSCHQLQNNENKQVEQYLLRIDLSWSHYRLLMRVGNRKARQFYIDEAANQNWNVEQLKRQINTFYYERLIASNDKDAVIQEATEKLKPLSTQPGDILKDPNIFEFLGLKQEFKYFEHELELRTVKIRMRELIDRVNRAIDKMGKGYDSGFFSTPIVTSILRVIEQRERKMKSLL